MSAAPELVFVPEEEHAAAVGLVGRSEHEDNIVDLAVRRKAHGLVDVPNGLYARLVKNVIDRVAAASLLLTLAPVLLVVAALVRVSLGPGVIFRQKRVGQGGRVFTILKFRTMLNGDVVDESLPEEDRWADYKSDDDPRHTPIGRWMRALSLDELPQLVNVMRGEMSLVGPRPELVELVDFDRLWGHPRHHVKPGLTCFWQLSPARKHRISEGLHHDVRYVESVSLRNDAALLVATAKSLPKRLGR